MLCCKGFLVVVGVLLFVHDGWGQEEDRRQRYRDKQRIRLAEVSRASTSFGVSLYRQLASREDNVIFSPLSVFTALSMTLLGTQGRTKAELRTVMAQRRRQGVHRALHAVFASFPRASDVNVTLRVANAVYYDDRQITVADTFNRSLRLRYGASPQPFERPNPEAAINDWVERQTGGKIQDFLDPGTITSDTVLMLLNAVYFQGTWENIFDERSTRDNDFTTGSGDVVRVPMMSRDGQYAVKPVGQGIAAQVLELPYGSDDRFAMFILLPDPQGSLADLEASLNNQVLEEALTNMPQRTRYDIFVPKFKLRLKTSLKEILQDMGLRTIFSNRANLARMLQQPRPLKVDDVMHEAVIEVNEKGTTAAAVTSVGIRLLSLPPQFVVNRPFLFVLRDKKARLNLFMGRVNDPTLEQD